MKYDKILAFARELRKNQTEAEAFFWKKVRNRRFKGLKFNRQFIFEVTNSKYYIVDFYCHERKLIVELDGKIHEFQLEVDAGREYELRELGFEIMRFSNEGVLENWEDVESRIVEFLGL